MNNIVMPCLLYLQTSSIAGQICCVLMLRNMLLCCILLAAYCLRAVTFFNMWLLLLHVLVRHTTQHSHRRITNPTTPQYLSKSDDSIAADS
jgi:hypothetical protein